MGRKPSKSTTPLGRRLVEVREKKGFPDRKPFALEAGFVPETLGGWEKGLRPPPADALAVYANKYDVDMNWLVSGEGEMFSTASKTQNKNSLVPDTFSYINRYEVNASAGDGLLVLSEEPIGQMAFAQLWLSEIGLDPEQSGVIIATGDSMYPTIPNGTPMIVDFRQTEHIISGHNYVFNIGGELMVKRLERTLEDEITLISDNPIYERRTINLQSVQDMKIIGRVRYILKDM